MKKEGSLKLILSLLIIVLLIAVSLGGIYVKDKNIMKNILPEYTVGMDLDTNTIIKLEVSKDEETSSEGTDEESNTEAVENEVEEVAETETNTTEENGQADENKENIYTAENYKKVKKIIENRLNESEINQYTIRLDEQTGVIVLEVPSDVDTGILQNTFVVGKTEIKVSETSEILTDYNGIKSVKATIDESYVGYGVGSFVRLDIDFTKDAVNKFKEVKNAYIIPTDEEGNKIENNIEIAIDGSAICSLTETEFLESAVLGTLSLTMGDYTSDAETLNNTLNNAKSMKVIMESEPLPVKYSVKYTNDIHSNVSKIGVISVFAVILIVMFVYLVFKYKLKGIIAEINIIGYLSLLLLVLRYAQVKMSIAAIVSLVVMLIIQFVYISKLLSNKKISSGVFNNETIEFTKMIIPTLILSVIIAFANIIEISGFGMVVFWGIILFEIFNNILTRAILTNVKNK